MDCPVCKAPGMCVCPSPETTDVRERARRVVVQAMDYKLLVPHAFKIIDALAAANLLRTPNVAATGGASAETLSPQDRDALERLRYLRNEHGSMNGRIRPEDAGAYALGFSDASIGRRVEVTRLTEDLAARTGERDELRLAILGGEDVPGVADTVPIAECIQYLSANRLEQQYYGDQATARADALQQRVGALEEAAKPFAFRGYKTDQITIYMDRQGRRTRYLASEDIENLRAALSQTPTPNAKTEGV